MNRWMFAPHRNEHYRTTSNTKLMQLLNALTRDVDRFNACFPPGQDSDSATEMMMEFAAHTVLYSAILEEVIARSCEQVQAAIDPAVRILGLEGLAGLVRQFIQLATAAANTLDARSVAFVRDTLTASAVPGVLDPIGAAVFASEVNAIQLTAARARSAYQPFVAELELEISHLQALAEAERARVVKHN